MGPHKLEIETEAMQLPGITLEQAIQYFATLLVETDDDNKVVQAARLLLALQKLAFLPEVRADADPGQLHERLRLQP